MICCEHVTKRYRSATVLDDISVEFAKGQIHGLIGRNGSGKTLLLKSICGLISLTSGTISIDGRQVRKDIEIPDRLGAIIESPGFLPHFSGFKNLRLLAGIQRKVTNEEIRNAMDCVGLDPRSAKWVGKYSMGMRQRLGIAQAIMEKPDLLILDEPMNGLDNNGVRDMRELFLSLRSVNTIIMLASHNPLDIQELCDTVHEMDAGRLVQSR